MLQGLESDRDTEGTFLGNYTYEADGEPIQNFIITVSRPIPTRERYDKVDPSQPGRGMTSQWSGLGRPIPTRERYDKPIVRVR